jgi:hypothetical protein
MKLRPSTIIKMNLVFIFFLAACGGGGGGGGSSEVPASSGGGSSTPISGSTQAIALTFSASSSDVELNGSVTLTWAGTNATSCDASGAWGGNNKAASGSETVNMTLVGTQTFSIVCKNSGDSVTASTSVEVYQIIGGTVLDGYIRGAEVFVDRNNNLTLDSNESSVTTDNNGFFSNLRGYNGQLIAKDGIDLDTGFIFENFSLTAKTATDKTDYIISPLTSVGSLLDTPSDINKIFGISDSIDVYSEDPVAKISEPAFANLYSIGNKLTVLAMSVQTLEGNNKNLQDIFQTIATQAQNIFIETESSIQVDNNVLISNTLFNQLPTTMDADLRSDLGIAIGNSLYLLQVKDNKAATTGIQNFAFTTLQSDLLKIQQLEAGVSTKYKEDIFNYVATDQNLSLSDVTVAITANDDSLNVNEDSQVMFTWSSIYSNDVFLRFADASASYVSFPQNGSITNTDLEYFYTPNPNFNGTDTFSYKLEQGGQETVATVTITVNPVNDLPVLSGINNSYQKTLAYGAQAVGSLGVSDVDGDAFTYSLSGADASLFAIGSSGEISFNSAATDARTYNITVQVSDGSATVTQDLEITVNPNQSPVISCGNCSYALEYGSKNVGSISSSDEEGDTITYSLSGTDASLFSINESGAVSFNSNATDARTYDVTVIASDGISTAAEKNLSITVNPRDPDTTYTGVTSGFETFTGGSGDDTFNPGPGNATIDGGSYNDTVIFFANRSNATLITLSGITKISFNSSNGCNDHCFDDYTLTNVETVTFADQSVTLSTTLPASLIRGSSNSTEIFDPGNSNDNVFDPGPGNATIDGGGGSDTVIFFANRSNATLITLSGITKISFNSSNGCNDHCFDDYTLTNVETVTFADQSVTLSTTLPASLIRGSSNSTETLNGNSNDNVFDPGPGNATIDGGGGSDTVIFFANRSNATLTTLSGITKISFNSSNGCNDHCFDDYTLTNVETVTFADQSVTLSTTLPASLIRGSSNSTETLNGNSNDNVFDPGPGNATIDGGGGSDTVIFFANRSNATLTTLSGITKISFNSSNGCNDHCFDDYTLTNVETVTFADSSVNLNAGWKQLGLDINGKFYGTASGRSVAMTGDGSRIVIGAPSPPSYGDNYVQVFDLQADNTWSQVGDDIVGSNGSNFGYENGVDISDDGNVLVVGAPAAAGNGSVIVYRLSADGWTNEATLNDGDTGIANSNFGRWVAISNDGSTIVYGATEGKSDGTYEGSAIVRKFNGSAWVQVGETIYGDTQDDYAGVVAINNDGTKIAIGAWRYDDSRTNNGQVRIFSLDQSNSSWNEIGDIRGTGDDYRCGTQISMDANGNTVAILCPGYDDNRGQVRIYDYNDGTWAQHGNDINGENEEDHLAESGSVALGSNGDYIVIGSNFNDGTAQEAGNARVFKYNSECTTDTCAEVDTWIQVGDDIDGESFKDFSGYSVAINALGTRVAIGAPQNDGDSDDNTDGRGHVRVFEYNE